MILKETSIQDLNQTKIFFEVVDCREVPDMIRTTLENPFFFGGTILSPGSLDDVVEIPDVKWSSEDGKIYRDPRTPAQIAKAMILEASRNGLETVSIDYNNVASGTENRGHENFEDRNDIIRFAHQKPTVVERTFATKDVPEEVSFEAHVVDTDNPNVPDYWSDFNADCIALNLKYADPEKTRNIDLQRVVAGRFEWTEVSES